MKKTKSGSQKGKGGVSPSQRIDARIEELGDWRGKMLSRLRTLIKQADPEVVEEWKWRGVPVWYHDGMICTGETYKDKVKMTFSKGAALEDPAGLFNSSLTGNTRRAIDFHEGDKIKERALRALIRAAVTANTSSTARRRGIGANPMAGQASKKSAKAAAKKAAAKPKLLSGGNPQIAKADGDAPVQSYIAAMPGWKCGVGKRLDALIVRTVPGVRKAVRWNSPFYGIEGQGWFLAFHCFTKYVKVTFFRGSSLRPLPPVESKDRNTRYFHIHEDGKLDEKLVASWIKQASELPGDPLF